jgi:hypothetical protein
VEFLDLFPRKGFASAQLHCYLFAKSNEDPLQLVKNHLRGDAFIVNPRVYNVRNVSPNKDMYRVSFELITDTERIGKLEEDSQEEPRKKPKLE